MSRALTYIHVDQINNPRALTAANKAIVFIRPFDGYNLIFGIPDPDGDGIGNYVYLGFPGQIYDEETGLYYNINRYYDSFTGRYTQSDPIGLLGGLNTYGYARQNPISFTDPDGTNPVAGAIEGAEIGGAVGGPVGAVAGAVVGAVAGAVIAEGISSAMESRGHSDPVEAQPFNPGKDCNGKCLPCPPNQIWPTDGGGHGHPNGVWHEIVWHQNPATCMCYPDRPSKGLGGW
jgi:RHS repeat-associated protein